MDNLDKNISLHLGNASNAGVTNASNDCLVNFDEFEAAIHHNTYRAGECPISTFVTHATCLLSVVRRFGSWRERELDLNARFLTPFKDTLVNPWARIFRDEMLRVTERALKNIIMQSLCDDIGVVPTVLIEAFTKICNEARLEAMVVIDGMIRSVRQA